MSVFFRQIMAMGTVVDLVIPDFPDERGAGLMQSLRTEISRLEQLYSNYSETSEISRFNRTPVGEPFRAGAEFLATVKQMLEYHGLTSGYFDITLGSWTSMPDRVTGLETGPGSFTALPVEERLKQEAGGLKRMHELTRLDAGGFGKGIALLNIEKIIRDAGITSAFISFGRSSVLAVGSHPQGDTWKVGIQHPEEEGRTIGVVELCDRSLSISGNSGNNRKKYGGAGHVFNPLKAGFVTKPGQIVVASPDPVEAEVLTTALFAAGKKGEEAFDAERFREAEIFWFDAD